MSVLPKRLKSGLIAGATTAMAFLAGAAPTQAATLNISNVPLFLQESVAPLNMLVMGRDHKLYYEAYNDRSDLDGDGDLDIGYLPGTITYYGYFDSAKCYTHDGAKFVPSRAVVDATLKTCGGADEWSGDWLNYVTTSRIDALRKVLYGGKRSTDGSSETVLERSLVPQDAHAWGKEYTSVAVDGYDIRNYTPYSAPSAGNRHLFANTTLMTTTDWTTNTGSPRMLVLLDRNYRIWHWVSKESPVAGFTINNGGGSTAVTHDGNYRVRVQVCVDNGDPLFLEANCRRYPSGNYKPTGLLQDFGQNDTMYFGLLTGSYAKSKSGGVLRRDVGSIRSEINVDTDGTFTSTVGIIRTIDRLRAAGYSNYTTQAGGYGVYYPPGLVTTRPFNEGEFGGMWGNPIAEMMYETLRYFSGASGPTTDFDYSSGIDSTAPLSLPKDSSWNNPYRTTQPQCAKPFMTVMSDVNTSHDTDQLPGSYFNSFTGDLTGLNVSTIADRIWNQEFGASGTYYIGQSGTTYNGAPTPKTITSFSNIRGLAPEEPTKEGGYYAASVAHYGLSTDINTRAGEQKVQTFAVALASPLPRIEIPVGTGRVTLVPFAKSVGGCAGVTGTEGLFQPTNQIVDFYVESLTPTSGVFQVNFEDVESGNDHDMDAIVRYAYVVAGNTVTVTLSSDYAAGCIIQHMGYIISGTTADGTYLEVRDRDTGAGSDVNYFLDTPNISTALPLTATRVFTAGTTPGASILKDPLWYAAKWGGFEDSNNNGIPDVQTEWDDTSPADPDTDPDNYFLVTNALTLGAQLEAAFEEIMERVGSASSASVNSGSISSETRVYQAKFNSGSWTGQLLSYPVNTTNGQLLTAEWDAADELPDWDSRRIVTVNSNGVAAPFRWDDLDDTRKTQIYANWEDDSASEQFAIDRLEYLRGSDEHEAAGTFRVRPSKLGDIVSSAPIFVGAPSFGYPDALESDDYSDFRDANDERKHMVYVGANDGMVHAFDAANGDEEFAFIPSAVFRNLSLLSEPTYSHRFYVDGSPNSGDVYINNDWETVLIGGLNGGGQEIYALNITDPDDLTEANADDVVMWEFTDVDTDPSDDVNGDRDLGYTYSQPAIVRLQNGRWAAVFGNGYNNTVADGMASTTGNAALYIVDIEDGTLIRKFDTGVGMGDDPRGLARPNGMSTPAVVDLNGDATVDYVYAGDLFGNMWKFDISSDDPSDWDFAYDVSGAPLPLYTAIDPTANTDLEQPITSRPEVIRGPRGVGMMVLFGTGKYIETNDRIVNVASPEVQTYYGLFDRNSGEDTDRITAATELVQQSITAEQTIDIPGPNDPRVRITTQNAFGNAKGWYLNLLSPSGYNGERQVSNTAVRAGRVVFTTLIPDSNPCNYGGTSWLMELDARTGGRLIEPPVDVNGDGVVDASDLVGGNAVGGIQLGVGISPEPGILLGEGGRIEYKYNPGTSGNISVTTESRPASSFGRQSWRQVR